MNVDVHPDGDRVVFDLLGDLYEVPLAGGPARRLSGGPAWDQDPRWSPDGQHLLFVSDRGGNQELWVRDLASGEDRALTKGRPERFAEGEWLPDGSGVIARKRVIDTRSIGMTELWYFAADGGDGVQLTRSADTPFPVDLAVSADGRFVYHAETPWRFEYGRDPNSPLYDLWRLDLDTGERRRLTGEPGGAFRPTVNPASGELAVLRRVAGHTVLERFDPVSGARARVGDLVLEHDNQEGFALNGLYPHADFTPDGRELVIWDDGALVRVDWASGAVTPIPWTAKVEHRFAPQVREPHPVAATPDVRARMVRWPRVSPDGRRVVFEAFGRLWLQGVDQAAPEPLTDGGVRAVAPSWSPDGQRIVYATWHDERQGDVRVLTLADGSERVLTAVPAQYLAPVFAPDGERVAWLRGSGAPLRGGDTADELWYRLELFEGGAVRDVMQHGASDGGARAQALSFSADGKRLLLVEDEPQDKPNTHARTVLASVNLEGRDRRVLARWDRGLEAAPSPDGREVAYVEKHRVFRAKLPRVGTEVLELGPEDGAVLVAELSDGAGEWVSWAGDQPVWAMGPTLHVGEGTVKLDARLPRVHGEGVVAWVNARILTMGAAGVIERGTLVIDGERIVAVGPDVSPPPGATVIDGAGLTLMPGLVDVHAHLHYGASDAQPFSSWRHRINLAYGVTTTHDPSAHDDTVFATAERIEAGLEAGPRVYSTGGILYGAYAKFRSSIESLDDARLHLARKAAVGAISVKSYQQPARDQRQWILQAAREAGLNVYPEGGGDQFNDLTMLLDGHTDIEHSLPVAPLYEDVLGFYAASGASYTPTLLVAYGGLAGEHWFYQTRNVLEDAKLNRFTPPHVLDRRARRLGIFVRDDDWYFQEVARAAAALDRVGVRVNLGSHGQLQGLGAHWELWALSDAMGPERALASATLNGAWTLGMEEDLGSLEAGKLADVVVLSANPLEDIRNSTAIVEVVRGGLRYDGETLERR